MNITISPNESPTIDVIIPSLPVVGVTTVPPVNLDVVGFPGEPGPPGPPGPSGTIVHVGPTAPPSPTINDLWVDTS